MKHQRSLWLMMALLAALALAVGCAQPPVQPKAQTPPEDPLVKGVKAQATWVGQLYNGFTTSSGEQFDMRKKTASHRSLAFGTMLEVINPISGKSVVVVVNDRRNLKDGIDLALSQAAAQSIGLYGPKRVFAVVYRYSK